MYVCIHIYIYIFFFLGGGSLLSKGCKFASENWAAYVLLEFIFGGAYIQKFTGYWGLQFVIVVCIHSYQKRLQSVKNKPEWNL